MSEPGETSGGGAERPLWNHTTPVTFPALFDWPPRPLAAIVALTRRWVTLSRNLLFLALAAVIYTTMLPELSTLATLSWTWVVPILLRNVVLMVVVAGGLHLYLFTFRAQASAFKYDARERMGAGKRYTFDSQVLDNMFWSLASGGAIWTTYEVLYLWGAANGVVPTLDLADHPIAFALWVLVLPNVLSLHFYLVHRLLHWPPLFKLAHKLHHRNVHIGPWSGMAMHPIEHVLYLSSVLVHFVIPTHPVIAIMHLYTRSLGPAFSHSGFEKIMAGDTKVIDSADFHHQLHHRFFECNYGNPDAPWDHWLGSLHDGSEAATEAVKRRRAAMYHGRRTRHASGSAAASPASSPACGDD